MVSSEYYDSFRHPTSANFLEGSKAILKKWFNSVPSESEWFCEVGTGHSILANFAAEQGLPMNKLVLLDLSVGMLAYSAKSIRSGAHGVVADVRRLPLTSSSLDLVLASLGDPYNCDVFWTEVHRVLKPGGLALFTTPSYEWASAFRGSDTQASKKAEFELVDHSRVLLTSVIYPPRRQVQLIRGSGLIVDHVRHVKISELKLLPLSSKLMLDRGQDALVVSGYRVRKPQNAQMPKSNYAAKNAHPVWPKAKH